MRRRRMMKSCYVSDIKNLNDDNIIDNGNEEENFFFNGVRSLIIVIIE